MFNSLVVSSFTNTKSMLIDDKVLDGLSAQAKASPRLRMNFDMRNSVSDGSQRMLNAIK